MPLTVFANRLSELMKTEGLSRRRLAINTGVERKSVISWLGAACYPRYDGLLAVCDYFQVSADYLLGLKDFSSENAVYKKVDLNEINKIFIERVSAYMQKNGVTQYRLAKELNIGQTSLSRWFKLGRMPTTDTLVKLSAIMNESLDFLLGRE